MAQTLTEGIERKKKRRQRWMPGERRQHVTAAVRDMAGIAGRIAPGFLLAFAEVMGIPSGLHAAYMAALGCVGESVLWPACGCLLAFVMRLVWGLGVQGELLVSTALALMIPALVFGKGLGRLMGCTALTLLPGALWRLIAGTAADALTGIGCIAIGALSAPVMLRAIRAIRGDKPIASMEERVAVGYLAGMLLCGGGRMLLFPVNVGAFGASLVTLTAALHLGVGPGALIGMLAGLTLAMQGLPVGLAVALSLGGFLGGMVQCMGRRWLTCFSFSLGCCCAMLLMGSAGAGCAMAALFASLVLILLSRNAAEQLQRQARRFITAETTAGDGYAFAALTQWEKTVAAMAQAVPKPCEEEETHTASWWKCRLCDGCPDDADCTAMLTELSRVHADAAWSLRTQEDETWQAGLENLRGLGCGRLYFLRDRMEELRREDMAVRKENRRLNHQRDMLVTHLTAMAGAARRFALLSGGESWWDEISARQLRRVLAETAYPAQLLYARRVQGHAQACFSLQRSIGTKKQAEELCTLTAKAFGLPMEVIRAEEGRVTLSEQPLWCVEDGRAAVGVDGCEVCGDTALCTVITGGRYLAAVSDGMGHGRPASQESRRTAELLRLCLDAGYTRQQTLTAVNGMMLLSSRGERFATVDMALIDLWTGHLTLDKMGAAGSWLIRGREMIELTGDALPLGILEEVDSQTRALRLKEGDQLFLMTDGVEEAFATREELRIALMLSADEKDASAAAWRLMHCAGEGSSSGGQDDRTAVVLRFSRTSAVQT